MLYSQLPVVASGNAIEIRDSSYYDHSDKSHNKTTLLMNIVSKSYNPNSHYYLRENCKTRYIPSASKGASRWIMQYHLIVHYYTILHESTKLLQGTKSHLRVAEAKGTQHQHPSFLQVMGWLAHIQITEFIPYPGCKVKAEISLFTSQYRLQALRGEISHCLRHYNWVYST